MPNLNPLHWVFVTPRLCSRCRSVLHREDEGTLIFCWNCGAPQVMLSEELREQIEKQLAGENADPSTVEPIPQPPVVGNSVVWKGAVLCAGFSGAVAAAFVLAAFVIPPVSLLLLFWLVGAPIVMLGIYSSRFRQTLITTSFGARLGLLSGIAILLATQTLWIVDLLLRRFVFHSAGAFDSVLATVYSQWHATVDARSGPDSAFMLHAIAIPEFRVGLLLATATAMTALYLAFSTVTGAFAGYLRSRAAK